MSTVAHNELFKKQNYKLLPSNYKKGVISSVNIKAFTASVYFSENPGNVIPNVPLASHIDPTKIVIGDKCRIDVFNETLAGNMVIAYIYGRRMS